MQMHRTRTIRLLALPAVAALALAGCSSDDSSDTSAAGSAGTQAPGTTAPAAGPCVEDATLTVTTDDGGTIELVPESAWADVTLDSSITVTIGNYEITQDEAESIYQPSLTGDQAGVTFYVSAAQGATLTTATYLDVASGDVGEYQLNTHTVYAPERVIVTGFDVPESVVEITEISDERVCGTISSPEVTGDFVAVRI